MSTQVRRMTIFDTSIIRGILKLLPNGTSKRLIMLVFFQIIATTLDICALLLTGILSKSGLEYVQGRTRNVAIPFSENSMFSALEFERQFLILTILVMALFTARTMLSIWGNRKILRYLGDKSANASQQIIKKFFESKPEYVISQNSQQILYGVTTGVDSLVLLYLGSLVIIGAEVFFLALILISLLIVQPISGICALAVFGISGLLIHKLTSSSVREKSEEISELSIQFSSKFLDILSIYRELLLRGELLESTLELQHSRVNHLRRRSEIVFLPIMTKYLFEFVLIFGSAILALVQLSLNDANTAISSIVVFLAASSRILPSIIRLQGALLTVKQSEGTGRISLLQLKQIGLSKDSYLAHPKEKESISNSPYLELKNVGYRFPELSEETLTDISLTIREGQFVAIVGESGAGKSTLADLLLGIRSPTSGSISLRGVSPHSYTLRFPGRVSYVPQDIKIIDGDILRNVALSDVNQTVENEVIESLKQAALWEDVRQMPQGLKTHVGEHGNRLSGGQRQRLGIARALYSKPELIIFDEATSSLDPLTEKVVTNSIYKRNDQVTLLVIAHRLSTVRMADLVVFLDKGKLVACGSFDEVRSKVPKFDLQAKLVNL